MDSPHTGVHRRYVSSASSTFYPASMYREVDGMDSVLPEGESFDGGAVEYENSTVRPGSLLTESIATESNGTESAISESIGSMQVVQPSFDQAVVATTPLSGSAARDEVVTNLEAQAIAFSPTNTTTKPGNLNQPDCDLNTSKQYQDEPETGHTSIPSSRSSGKMSANETSHFSAKAIIDRYNKINSNKHKKPKAEAAAAPLPPTQSAVNAIATPGPTATKGGVSEAAPATAAAPNHNHNNGYPFKKPLTSFGKVLVAPVNLLVNGTTSTHPPPSNIRVVDSRVPQPTPQQMAMAGPHPNNPNHYVQPPQYNFSAVRPQFLKTQYPDGTGNYMEIPIVLMDYTDEDKFIKNSKKSQHSVPVVSTPVQQIKGPEHYQPATPASAAAIAKNTTVVGSYTALPAAAAVASAATVAPQAVVSMPVAAKPKKVALHARKGVRVVAPDASSLSHSHMGHHPNAESEVLEYAPMMPGSSSSRRRARAPTEKSMSLYSRRGELVVDVPYSSVRNGMLSDPVGVPVIKGDRVPEPPIYAPPAKPPKEPLERSPKKGKPMSSSHPEAKREAVQAEEDTSRLLYNSWLSTRAAIEGWATETVGGITATLRPTLPPSQVLTAKQAAEMSAARYMRANPDLRAIETAANGHTMASPQSVYSSSMSSGSYSSRSESVSSSLVRSSILESSPRSGHSHTTGVSQPSTHTATATATAAARSTSTFPGTPASSQIKVRIPIANVPLRDIEPTLYTGQGDVDMEMVDRSRIGSPVPGFGGPGGTYGPEPRTPGAPSQGLLEAAALKAHRSPAFSKLKQIFGGKTPETNNNKIGGTVGNTPRGVPRVVTAATTPAMSSRTQHASTKHGSVYGFGVDTKASGEVVTDRQLPPALAASGPLLRGVFAAIRRVAQLSVILRPIDNVADTVPMLYPTVIILEVLALLWLLHQVSMILEVILAVTRTISAPVAGLSHILTAGLGGAAKASVEEIVEGAGGRHHVL